MLEIGQKYVGRTPASPRRHKIFKGCAHAADPLEEPRNTHFIANGNIRLNIYRNSKNRARQFVEINVT